MEEQLATIQFLSREIGPRPPTSVAEAQAAAYVNARMRQSGLDVEIQTFRSVPTVALPYGLILLAHTLTPALFYFLPPAALGLSLLALAAFVGECTANPLLSPLFPLGTSQNIIATRPPSGPTRRHLVVLAHLDTPRANWLFHPRLGSSFRRFFLLLTIALAAQPLLVALAWVVGPAWLGHLLWLPAAISSGALLIFLHQELFMPWVSGANGGASGVAVLLRLAEEVRGLQHTALWLVATGCKEAGLEGVRQFLRHYPFSPADTFVLSVDHVGRGELSIIVDQGMLWPCRTGNSLPEVAAEAEAADIAIDADPRSYHLLNTEALVALRRGLPALSVMALEGGRPAHAFWPTDTAEHVQPELLDRATRLIAGIARLLDRRAAEETPPGEAGPRPQGPEGPAE